MLSLDAFESNSDTGWNPDVIEATLDCPSVYYINCKFNRKGTMLAVGGSKGECVIYDFETRGIAKVLTAHKHKITSSSWSRSSRELLTSSYDGTVLRWDALEGVLVNAVGFDIALEHSALHPTQTHLALATPHRGLQPCLLDFKETVPVEITHPAWAKLTYNAYIPKPKTSRKQGARGDGSGDRAGNTSGGDGDEGNASDDEDGLASHDNRAARVAALKKALNIGPDDQPPKESRSAASHAINDTTNTNDRNADGVETAGTRTDGDGDVAMGEGVGVKIDRSMSMEELKMKGRFEFVFQLFQRPATSSDVQEASPPSASSTAVLAPIAETPGVASVEAASGRGSTPPVGDGTREKEGKETTEKEAVPAAAANSRSRKKKDKKDKKVSSSPPTRNTIAVFSKTGDKIFVGSSKGHISVYDTETRELVEQIMPSGRQKYIIKDLVVSKDGLYLLSNSSDRVIRVYSIQSYNMTREFHDTVNRTQWVKCVFSGNSDYIVAASNDNSVHKIHIYNREFGNLVKILQCAKEGVWDLCYHPTRPILCSCSSSGLIYIWGKKYSENWSAFAADFEELEENDEFIEREDEFDRGTFNVDYEGDDDGSKGKDGGEVGKGNDKTDVGTGGELVDITTIDDTNEWSSDEEDELHFLPVEPVADEECEAEWKLSLDKINKEKSKKRLQGGEAESQGTDTGAGTLRKKKISRAERSRGRGGKKGTKRAHSDAAVSGPLDTTGDGKKMAVDTPIADKGETGTSDGNKARENGKFNSKKQKTVV